MRSLAIIVLGGYLALVVAARTTPSDLEEWTEFKQQHGKDYLDQQEDAMRMSIFKKNKKFIDEFNKDKRLESGFRMSLNKFADWTEAEIETIKGVRGLENYDESIVNSPTEQKFLDDILNDKSIEVPDEVDWRKVPGRVSSVKDQGSCGSCWAFSTVGALEGQEIVHNKTSLVSLSVQDLVDCAKGDQLLGCKGGYPLLAMDYISKVGGIQDDKSYPYVGEDNDCRFKKENAAFTDKGGVILPVGDENKLKEVVAKFGPVSICINAERGFLFYTAGILKEEFCPHPRRDYLNHAILVVGYGADPNDGDYWIMKNSWGADWGESGYIRMARNRDNMCGIADFAVIPTF